MSLGAALQLSSRSLEAFSAGIGVAGQNIANAGTPGYVRENLKLSTANPYRTGGLTLGTGVAVGGVRQEINLFLETRVQSAKGDAAAAAARSGVSIQLEDSLNELGDDDLSTSLSNFSAALQDVANQPESAAFRRTFVAQGAALARDVVNLRSRVDTLRQEQNGKVGDLVKESNGLIDQIERLNSQIVKLEQGGLSGSDAGGLRTQRYAALQRLAEIVPVGVRQRENGAVDVNLGGDYLLLDGAKQHLETVVVPDRELPTTQVRTTTTKSLLPGGGGEIRGLIDGRDQTLGGFVDDLNALATGLIGTVNRLHAGGEGVSGYAAVTAERAVKNPAATLDAAGLPFPVTHGGFDLKVVNKNTGLVTTTRIAVDLDGLGGNDTTLNSLAAQLGAAANVTATLDAAGTLTFSAADGYELKFGDDTSGALAALGINTFFTGKDSADLGVGAALQRDPGLLATGRGAGAGDNRGALALVAALAGPVAALNGRSLSGHYEATVGKLAVDSSAERTLADGSDAFLHSLLSQREQYSGVSLDEEAVKIMELQHGFQASARIISTIDQLFGVLLNL